MKPWHKIVNAAAKNGPAEILIYDQIGKDWFSNDGIAAKDFAETLKGIAPDREIVVGINSPGGNVWDGLAIHNMLLARKAKVTTRNDGIAASIASIILMAGSERQANTGSLVMIHRAWGMSVGNAADMTKMAAELEKHDGVLADIYSVKTGKPKDQILQLMAEETWFTGQEAKDAGFISELLSTAAALNSVSPDLLAQFKKAPDALKNPAAPQGAVQPPTTTQPQENQMKKAIVALLTARGQTVDENATEDQLKAQLDALLDAKPAPAPAAANKPEDDRFAKIEARFARERENNVVRALDQLVIDNKITADEAKVFKAGCIADESDNILATLQKREPVLPGAAPILGCGIQVGKSGGRDHVVALATPRARFNFMRDNYADLMASGYRKVGSPRAANTTDAQLVTDMLTDGFTTFAQNRLASLRMFTKEVSPDRLKPMAVLQHRFVNGAGTAQTNATSFEDTTNFIGTETNVAITMARITSGAHLTNLERQNGVTMAQWVEAKTGEFCDAVAALRNAVILEGTYTKTPTVSADVAFGSAELKKLWGQLKKYSTKNIALDGEYYAQFLPEDKFDFSENDYRFRGWDNFMLDTNWSGATANTVGFACNPQAMVAGLGLPLRSDRANAVSTESILTLPGLGLSVSVTDWYSNITRNDWTTYDAMIGFAALDANAGVLIKSA